ncbi:MAG: ABC transporter permease, partial [Myxococcaceae bacterium]
LGDWPRFLDGAPISALTRPWGESATKAGLLLLTGLSVAVAFQAGLFNIGAQGQMMVGAIAAAVLGAAVPLPWGIHPLVCVLAAASAGAVYAALPAVLKVKRGVHEVISTIMLNWIASSLVENWLVVGPLAAKSEGGLSRPGTEDILATAQLPRLLDGTRLHAGFLLALLMAVFVYVWQKRSVAGYETRAVGLAPEAARTAGIAVERTVYIAMSGAGALAGMAGALLVLGTEYKFPATLGAPYGFDGIAMALLGQGHPLGVLLNALFFGVMRAGGTRLQLLGVHKSFPELMQGLALLLVAARWMWTVLLTRRRRPSTITVAAEAPRV